MRIINGIIWSMCDHPLEKINKLRQCQLCRRFFSKIALRNLYEPKKPKIKKEVVLKIKLPKVRVRSISIRQKILYLKGWECQNCRISHDNPSFFDIDHIKPKRYYKLKPKSSLTLKQLRNLQILCPNCHRLKTIEEGWKSKK